MLWARTCFCHIHPLGTTDLGSLTQPVVTTAVTLSDGLLIFENKPQWPCYMFSRVEIMDLSALGEDMFLSGDLVPARHNRPWLSDTTTPVTLSDDLLIFENKPQRPCCILSHFTARTNTTRPQLFQVRGSEWSCMKTSLRM